MSILPVVIVSVLALLVAGIAAQTITATNRRVARIAEALGLETRRQHGGPLSFWNEAVGQIGGYDVHIDLVNAHDAERSIRLRVRTQVPTDVTLCREDVGQKLMKLVAGADHIIGEPGFDSAVVVRGPQVACHAVLGSRVRDLLKPLLTDGVTLHNGWLEQTRMEDDKSEDEVVYAARALAVVAGELGRGELTALESVVLEDPVSNVRARALATLAEADVEAALRIARAHSSTLDLGGSSFDLLCLSIALREDGDASSVGLLRAAASGLSRGDGWLRPHLDHTIAALLELAGPRPTGRVSLVRDVAGALSDTEDMPRRT